MTAKTQQIRPITRDPVPPPEGSTGSPPRPPRRHEEPTGASRPRTISLMVSWLLLLGSLAFSYWLYQENARERKAANEARASADDLVDFLLDPLRNELETIGRVDLLELPARKALAYLTSVPDRSDSPQQWHRRGIALDNIGDVLAGKGESADAREAFRESLRLTEQLVEKEPEHPLWQREMAISLSKVGDMSKEMGDLADAASRYTLSLEILDRLAQSAPDDRERQYDLGLAHERLGYAYQARGDLAASLVHFQARQIIASTLHTLEPENVVWCRDLALSYGTVGDVRELQGDSAGALASYRRLGQLAEALALLDPDRADWQRDFAISQEKLGDAQAAMGDVAAAAAAYQRFTETIEKLARSNPDHIMLQRDLAAGRTRLAAVQEKQGKLADALVLQTEGAEALSRLAHKLGTEGSRQQAGDAWAKLAWYCLLQRQFGKARDAAEKGAALAPTDLRTQLNLAHALLLDGMENKAEKIYRAHRNALLPGGRKFDQVVAEDFRVLMTKGIYHSSMQRIPNGLKSAKAPSDSAVGEPPDPAHQQAAPGRRSHSPQRK